MATPQTNRKGEKPAVHLSSLNDIRIGTPAYPRTFPLRATAPPTPPPQASVADYTFEQYQAANLNVTEKHNFIGKLRDEMPIMDRDEVDDLALRDLGKLLESCIFPTCKMIHIDPVAVKRMLDDSFRKAYGLEVEMEVMGTLGLGCLEDMAKAAATSKQVVVTAEKSEVAENNMLVGDSILTAKTNVLTVPPSKKTKKMPPNNTQKGIKAYITRRKRGRHGVHVMCLSSEAVCRKWAAMECES